MSAPFRIKIRGYDRFVNRLGEQLQAAVWRAFSDAGKKIESELKQASEEFSTTGDFRDQWHAGVLPSTGVNVRLTIRNTSRHATYTEYGRAPGKMPPLGEIAEWAEIKGIIDESPAGLRYNEGGPNAPLDVGDASVGRRSVRPVRIPRAERAQRRGPVVPSELRPRDVVFMIARHIGRVGTRGKLVAMTPEARERQLRIIRDQVKRQIRKIS